MVAQVRRNGVRQAQLARFLETVTLHPLDDGKEVGQLIARTGTSDVVDAYLGGFVAESDVGERRCGYTFKQQTRPA